MLRYNNIKKKGFTLIEVIVSIAIVSFLSIYLIQIFITAKNLNAMAYDLDNAVIVSKSVMESLSAGETIGDTSNDIFLKSARKMSDEPIYKVRLGEDFEPIDSDFVEPSYSLDISFNLINASKSINDYGLYDVSIYVTREEPYFLKVEQNKQIYSLNASKQLHFIEGGILNE